MHKENELGFGGAVVAAAVAGGRSSQILPLGTAAATKFALLKKTGGEMKFSSRVNVWVLAPKSFQSREAH